MDKIYIIIENCRNENISCETMIRILYVTMDRELAEKQFKKYANEQREYLKENNFEIQEDIEHFDFQCWDNDDFDSFNYHMQLLTENLVKEDK